MKYHYKHLTKEDIDFIINTRLKKKIRGKGKKKYIQLSLFENGLAALSNTRDARPKKEKKN